MKKCSVCGKHEQRSRNRSHSQRQTLRTVYANLQMDDGEWICTRCKKTRNRD